MELADYSLLIEEALNKETTDYECIELDEDDVAVGWSFVIEDAIPGYLFIDENEYTYDLPTVSMGLHILDVTELSREALVRILKNNAGLINATFSIVNIPVLTETDEKSVDKNTSFDDDFMEYVSEKEQEEFYDILTIQSKVPLDAFQPEDFMTYIQNLLFQTELFMPDVTEEGLNNEDIIMDS